MNWNLSLGQKFRAVAALALVFLLVLATNVMDSNYFSIVRNSLSTIYEDRLVANDYIYKISQQVHAKQLALHTGKADEVPQVSKVGNDSINSLMYVYGKTKLTTKEAQYFSALQEKLENLYNLEKQLVNANIAELRQEFINKAELLFSKINGDLDQLSDIQLQESKRQIQHSFRAIETSDLISRFEIGTLIVIGIFVQILIFYKSSD